MCIRRTKTIFLTLIFIIIIIFPKHLPSILADKITTKTKLGSLNGEKLKTQLLESLNSYGRSRGSEEFLEPIGNNQKPQKLFLDAQTTFKGRIIKIGKI